MRARFVRARLVVIAMVMAAIVGFAQPTSAAAGTPTVVVAFRCFLAGGHVSEPAGSEIVVANGWVAKTPGLVQDVLNAQTTTVSVNGGVPVDVSGRYIPIFPLGTDFATRVFYDTGITLGAGDSMRFEVVMSLSHRVLDGFTFASDTNDKPLFFGPGVAFVFPCTVTGV
jgi:hypothetical protein